MIGGTNLILPMMFLTTGWLASLIICVCTGLINYFTSYLTIVHLGEGKTLKEWILTHFNNSELVLIGYNVFAFAGSVATFAITFHMACTQIFAITGVNYQWISIVLAVILIIYIIINRAWHLGE